VDFFKAKIISLISQKKKALAVSACPVSNSKLTPSSSTQPFYSPFSNSFTTHFPTTPNQTKHGTTYANTRHRNTESPATLWPDTTSAHKHSRRPHSPPFHKTQTQD